MYNPAKISSKFFYNTKLELFGNNIGKELQNSRPKLKNMYIIYLLRVVVFWKHVLIL